VTPRRLIASYDRYEDAQRAVDHLSDHKFPVERVTIVGSDLRLVERVTGRLTVARAALLGAATGAWFGLLIGLIFWIVSPWAFGAVLSGLLIGLVFGAVWGAVGHAFTGGRRDFTSLAGLEAARYDLLADEPDANTALRLLAELGTPGVPTASSAAAAGAGAAPAATDPVAARSATDQPAGQHRAAGADASTNSTPAWREDRL
jgi:hypothetical protein